MRPLLAQLIAAALVLWAVICAVGFALLLNAG